jgi:membrane protein DedA with SNARE-associated domain
MLLANIFTDLTDWLEEVSGNWWFLVVIVVIAYLDSIVPAVPSETTVILGGIAAGFGTQQLWAVIACGAVGAFLGDNTAYLIGLRFSERYEARASRRPKTAARLAWAKDQIRSRGGLLLITARFIPGGRTVLTISSGITRQPHGWFARWVAVAAVIWASYAAILGRIFGEAFKDDHTLAFWLAFGTALSITVIIEVVRHVRAKRKVALTPTTDV